MLAALTNDRESGRRSGRKRSGGFASATPGKPRGSLALAGFVALLGGFVTTAGAGGANGAVAAMGAGVAITGLSYAAFTVHRRRLANKVAGTAYVISAGPRPVASTHGRCDMRLVIQAPRLAPTAVRHRDSAVPTAKWPTPGTSLPVTLDPRDLRDLRIHWDRVRPAATRPRTASNPRVDHLSEAPAGAPDQHELATLTDASELTGGPDGNGRSPIVGKNHAPSPDRTANINAAMSGSVVNSDDPMNLRFLDPLSPMPLSDDDLLLEEYGSPIREVGVTLIVSDLKQSLEFYRDLLGFFEIESGPDMVLLEARTGRLVLRQRDDTHATAPRLMHLSLEVNDIDAAYHNLARRGVEFIDEPRIVLQGELLELWAVSFHDPDGHGVALTCWQPRNDVGGAAR